MRSLRGKNAIITGASRGMGVEIANALAREGVNVALVARSAADLDSVAEGLSALGVAAIPIVADITEPDDRRRITETAAAQLGQVDILINNAGAAQWVPFSTQEEADARRLIETNLLAPILLSRLLLPGMVERRSGHIVNISSASAKRGIPYEAVYSASKAGLVEFTHAVRMELAGTGVGLSVICPVYYATTGGFARERISAPRLVGALSCERVTKVVVSAIRNNTAEIVLWRGPIRLVLGIIALSPALGDTFLRAVGVVKLNRRLAGLDGSESSASWKTSGDPADNSGVGQQQVYETGSLDPRG